MNWTSEQAKAYMQKRLRDEARARERMQTNLNPVQGAEPMKAKGGASPHSQRPNSECKSRDRSHSKKIPGSGQKHNKAVARAFFLHNGLPEPRTEWQFDPDRKWRWDYCWNALEETGMLALEVNGGLWTGGAHVRPARMLKEYEKWNRAACLGWRVLFVTPDQLLRLDTVNLIKEALGIAASVR